MIKGACQNRKRCYQNQEVLYSFLKHVLTKLRTMCYSVSTHQDASLYNSRYQMLLKGRQLSMSDAPQYYFVSGFEHPRLPVITDDGIFLYEWGLIPWWTKDEAKAEDIRNKTLNAVGETVFEKPSFKKSIGKKRCLLPVAGFFEWRSYNKAKYPYFIKPKTGDFFSLGCIYEQWVDKATGEERNTFSILTTPANPLLEEIHNLKKRMPLIIENENEAQWITPTLSKGEIQALIRPFPQERMEAYTVSKLVSNVRNDRNVAEALAEKEYEELPALQA